MNIKEATLHITKQLSITGIELPAMEARILLGHILNKPKEYLIINSAELLNQFQLHELEKLISRRLNFEPIAYITGNKEFYGRDFEVNPHVLLPRPDSETLIEAVLSNASGAKKILELGVGSGCLIITLLLEIPGSTAIGVDIDSNALDVATKNATKHKVLGYINFIESDWFKNLKDQKFDVIISNPPYISNDLMVAKETILHEPHKALFAGNNGLEAYFEIANQAKRFLNKNGKLYIEIGYNQNNEVSEVFLNSGYKLINRYKDLTDYIRCLELETI